MATRSESHLWSYDWEPWYGPFFMGAGMHHAASTSSSSFTRSNLQLVVAIPGEEQRILLLFHAFIHSHACDLRLGETAQFYWRQQTSVLNFIFQLADSNPQHWPTSAQLPFRMTFDHRASLNANLSLTCEHVNLKWPRPWSSLSDTPTGES